MSKDDEYKCPQCGGQVHHVGWSMYVCELCDEEFDIEELIDSTAYTQEFDDFSDADPGL